MGSTIVVVDYGMGNLRSVSKAIEHVCTPSQNVIVSSNAAEILAADRIVFPGQGAARDCMAQLNKFKLTDAVRQAAQEKPFLGICMGLQVLLEKSEENNGVKCMGLYRGTVRAFSHPTRQAQMLHLKIPHMGWNKVTQQEHPLWHKIKQDSRFYFVHSYYVDLDDDNNSKLITGSTNYGINFTSAIANKNVFAVQFHPEKSAHDGLQLLKNFCQWDGQKSGQN